ncbi:MAG: class I SAM-dependent methyltransferase [Pyrinomonadaceae bacterium]
MTPLQISQARQWFMQNLDHQVDYWNRVGPGKPFAHPVNFERLEELLSPASRILDVGCGYGRALGLLFDGGYHNLIGFDPAPAMVAMARKRFPAIAFEELNSPPHIPLADDSVDAAMLFSVLTCVPTDHGQRAVVAEVRRVLRPGGLLYISDLWLQTDERNLQRYDRDQPKYGTYGIFDLPEGVTVRHHKPEWIAQLTSGFETQALDNIDVHTMNGNPASAFQWFGSKRMI